MKAIEIDREGRLIWTAVPNPQLGDNDVLIDIRSSGVNRADLGQREGRYPPPAGAPPYMGLECAGQVVATGANVVGIAVGDIVCALLPGGGYAEQVAVNFRLVLPVPGGVSITEAGGIVEAACTVWSNLVEMGSIASGDTVLVHGGASGIGTFAIQIAKALGASVVTTAGGDAKLALCRRLGADLGIDYMKEDFVDKTAAFTGGRGVDLILDVMGGDYLERNLDALARKGRLLIIGIMGGVEAQLPIGVLLQKAVSVTAASLRNRPLQERVDIVAGVRRDIWPLIEQGLVVPVVDSSYGIHEADAAQKRMQSGQHAGKILLIQ